MTITAENYVQGCLDMPKLQAPATRDFAVAAKPVIADPKQYMADIQSVLTGTIARPVTKAARLGH